MNAKKFAKLSEELKFASAFIPTYSETAGGYHADEIIVLADGFGKGKPVFESDVICFNGTKVNDMGHETFYMKQDNSEEVRDPKEKFFKDFCKTARKPYDLMVCISLLRMKHHFPKVEISTDGNEKDWAPAFEVYQNIFKEEAPKIKY